MPQSQAKVREEFAKGKNIRRMDIQNIEYKLRYANRRLEKLKTDEVIGSRSFTPKN
ncbi:unnamed protein product [Oikopleura dioica]|uniref:Uncharacterized protein n=1 Tax=Oikopleura dioica TaxID=34765 RepID=E4XP49_OIKDI|nr:unnamed protein product [Oikopleura dioica]CBY43815.1 unnamed protein product [Oikopleura dioica]